MKVKQIYIKSVLTVFTMLFIFQGCHSDKPVEPGKIDIAKLETASKKAGEIYGMISLLVMKDNVMVLEEYYNNSGPSTIHDVMSVTKSFTSALIGIAIDKGYIQSTDQKLSDYLSPVADSINRGIGDVTIHQLLTMTCGHEWFEIGEYSEYDKWINSPDQVEYILNKPIVFPPGTKFNYSDGAAHLVSAILEEATGKSACEFAGENLFNYLGFEKVLWTQDNRGYNYGGVGLNITARDMIEFGRLFLNNGKYDNRQIISSEWIDTSTKTHINTSNAINYGENYGYFWWRGREHSLDYYFATGFGGQFIFIVPDLKIVASATCKWSVPRAQAGENWLNILKIIVNDIVPVFK